MSIKIGVTHTLPVTLTYTETAGGARLVECRDCGKYKDISGLGVNGFTGGRIAHGRRCGTPGAQLVEITDAEAVAEAPLSAAPVDTLRRDVKAGAASLHDEAALRRAVDAKFISVSDAMNRDF